jgi:exodeoxyribonuclease III
MKLVAWNCCTRDEKAAAYLRGLGTDVAALSEVGTSGIGEGVDWHWNGGLEDRGVAIAAFSGSFSEVQVTPARWGVAGLHDSGISLLGLWSSPAEKANATTCAAEVVSAVHASADLLTQHPGVVAGDLNSFSFDKPFGKAIDALAELGYISLYHHRTGELLQSKTPHPETTPTFYMQWNKAKPYHIDYCFVSEKLLDRVTGFEIGGYDQTVKDGDGNVIISDHVPLVLDLDV